MGTLRVCRPADYLPPVTVGQWPPAIRAMAEHKKGGDPKTDLVTEGADSELPPWQPEEKAAQLPQKRGEEMGTKDTSVRGEGTQEPWRRGATGCSMLSRQLQA